jgi:parallel beta-helix repeat protein
MTVNLSALAGAGQQFFDNSGNLLTGGKLYSYEAGTTTPQATYTSVSGATAHTNPIVLDSAGRVATGEIWVTAGQNYKFVLKTSTEVTLATWDNITGINGTGIATNAEFVEYDPPFTNSVATNVEDKLAQTVSVMDFGAVGDGVTNDTTAFVNACAAATNVIIPEGVNILIQKTTLNHNDLNIVMEGNAKITLSNSDLTGNGLSLTGDYMKITGGEITVSGAGYFAGFLVDLSGFSNILDNVKIHFFSKPSYTGDGVNIPYNTGVVRLNLDYCEVRNCNIYWGQGAGVWSYYQGAEISNNRIHNNITGIAIAAGDNCRVIDNLIYDNNATTVPLSGADGILTYGSKGHIISGNIISGSSEHGTYIQSTNNTITNNVVYGNPGSGLKCGGAFSSTVSGNSCYNNGGVIVANDDADIYIQSPFGNSTISNNQCSNTGGVYGIRCVWISGKAVVGEESRMIFDGNAVKGIYSERHIRVNGESDFVVSNNITNGTIELGQSAVGDPTMTRCQVSNNTSQAIVIDKSSNTLVSGNLVSTLTLNTSAASCAVKGNTITAQAVAIGDLFSVSEFSYNNVTYTQTTNVNSLFNQSANSAANSNKRFIGNKFDSSGGRFIYFTTSGVSGNYNQFVNNEFNGASIAVYTWGTNIQFVGNRSLSTTSIAFLQGTNGLITNNLAAVSIDLPGSNTVANNLTPV